VLQQRQHRIVILNLTSRNRSHWKGQGRILHPSRTRRRRRTSSSTA
jgi:hypothetical protein